MGAWQSRVCVNQVNRIVSMELLHERNEPVVEKEPGSSEAEISWDREIAQPLGGRGWQRTAAFTMKRRDPDDGGTQIELGEALDWLRDIRSVNRIRSERKKRSEREDVKRTA